MTRIRILTVCAVVAGLVPAGPGATASAPPDWVRPAIRHLDAQGLWAEGKFHANWAMRRSDFKALMLDAFGGGYRRTKGKVTAGEVSAALVRALGKAPVAAHLLSVRSPDGWDPGVHQRFGSEVVARELGLRRDRPTSEEAAEASANEPMRQADIAWAVWKALTEPSTYASDALASFELDDYGPMRRHVVAFALSLVGTPYVWGGEWAGPTPADYPYGAQPHGGFDCSGFIWYVLREQSELWAPAGRPYAGWSLPERSSSEMAKATEKRLAYEQLRPGDLIFFSPEGRKAQAGTVYHAGLYLGKGWMIHSSGGRAGISLAPVAPGSWWHDQIAWGRRVIQV